MFIFVCVCELAQDHYAGLPRHFPHATFGNTPVYSTCTYVDSNMESTAMLFFDVFRTLERGAISTVGVSARPLQQNVSMFVWLSLCLCGAGREGLWHVTHARAAMATDGTWELSAQGMYMSCSPVEPVKCHFRRAEKTKNQADPRNTHTQSAVFMILYTQFMNYPLLKNIHQKCVYIYFWAMDSS